MNGRTERITAAEQTLQAFRSGFYTVDGTHVDLTEQHKYSMEHITLYTPASLETIEIKQAPFRETPRYTLTPTPVVSALSKLKVEGKGNIGILNFASAKNAGGGFLNGALAQEESLVMCSNLYLTQLKQQTYYETNRHCGTMLYTDHMIYSKDVVFIREDSGSLFKVPLIASVLTAPAVNMGQYLLKGNSDIALANQVMKNRMRRILQVFAAQQNEILVLGAYGCGVFRNDPETVATFFQELLEQEELGKYFKEIVFAVYDRSKNQNVYRPFKEKFDTTSTREPK